MISIDDTLREAEQTPDWDMQKLRTHIGVLTREDRSMTQEQRERYKTIVGRFRGRMHNIMPTA